MGEAGHNQEHLDVTNEMHKLCEWQCVAFSQEAQPDKMLQTCRLFTYLHGIVLASIRTKPGTPCINFSIE